MTIHLTQAEVQALLDYNPETGVFRWNTEKSNSVHIGDIAGGLNSKGYRYIMIDERHFNASLLAWYYVHGVWLERVDHANRNPSDDRLANLRPVTRAQNRHNAKVNANSKSGHKGVRYRKDAKKWQARLQVAGIPISLGHFATQEEAIAAYKAYSEQHYGQYASNGHQ